MTRKGFLLLVFMGSALCGGLSSWLVLRFQQKPPMVHHHLPGEEEPDFHHWLHHELRLSPEQEAAMAPQEKAYHRQQEDIRQQLTRANEELAHVILLADAPDREVESALTEVNRLQGELQALTLDHFFAMKEHLDADQARSLLQWVHNSISHEH
ncbi:periplasmic heavy metal sensor [Roseibacillus ishigakijimensis]|uniref:Periplasmic heavy metal sensor n=1 Tax=Roseibacillus ishigakijimensis TaxID=454146 RepID=A0A934RLB5_9BACT|nr:periplasmic heavy metal sensor [Roseibacillus ishigakijimensis]MBK1833504.1 periplasmic heavy metal sensor [Roseibacillus ishigakijimensis]